MSNDMDLAGYNNALSDFAAQASRVIDPTKLAHDNEDIARFNQLVGGITQAVGEPIATKGFFGAKEKIDKAIMRTRKTLETAASDKFDELSTRVQGAAEDAFERARQTLAGPQSAVEDIVGQAQSAAAGTQNAAAAAVQDVGGRIRGINRASEFGTPEEGVVSAQPYVDTFDSFDEAGRTIPGAVQPRGLLARIFGQAARAPRPPPMTFEDPEFSDAFSTPGGDEGIALAQRFGGTGRVASLSRVFGVAGETGDAVGRFGGAPRLVRLPQDDDPAQPSLSRGITSVDDAPSLDAAAADVSGDATSAAATAATAAADTAAEAGTAAAGAIADTAAAAEGGLNPIADVAALILGLGTVIGGIGAEEQPKIPKLAQTAVPSFSRGIGNF